LMLFGAACKQAASFSKLDKAYIAEITLGMVSTTGDKEGELKPHSVSVKPSLDQVRQALTRFTGEITQVPSVYSAIKINGQEAYKRVRRGESVEMPSRIVKIYDLRITHYEYPKLKIDTKVSSGTYIRSLAEDVGEALSTGGYLSGLVRTEVGKFKIEEAMELHDVDASLLRSTIRKV
jgi:tRNA pseudouridine55 synthase